MNPTREQVTRIVEKATWSPSGDNCQPWTFEWSEDSLKIYHSVERGKHPLNPRSFASFLALGTLLTALDLSASDYGYSVDCKFFEFTESENALWVVVKFMANNRAKDSLSDEIPKRSTDRRKFNGGDLNSKMFTDNVFGENSSSEARIHIAAKPSEELKNYILNAEQLLMNHPEILPATLEWVRFSRSSAQKTNDGMLWNNMRINFWELPMVPIMRDVPGIINILGPMIKPQNYMRVKQQLGSAAGLVCVSVPKTDTVNIVQAGQLMMSAWLKLTQLGYGVQPLTISSATAFCVRKGIMNVSQKWKDLFSSGNKIMKQGFSVPDNREIVWMVRTGQSTSLPDKMRTLRKPVEDVLKFK